MTAYVGRRSHRTKRVGVSRALSLWAILTISTGCVRTTIRSGLAPGGAAPGWEENWHHAFVFGLDEFPGPILVNQLCPDGWSEVDTFIDPMQAAVAILTLGIYTPTTVSVVCADHQYGRNRVRVVAPTVRDATR